MSFGTRLKDARKIKKLTQKEVADKMGIDFTTISKYENDKSEPDNETLKKLAELYEVQIDFLLGHSHYPSLSKEDHEEFMTLTPKDLMDKYNFCDFDGKPISKDEVYSMLAYLKSLREMRSKE